MNKHALLARAEIVALEPYQHAAWKPTLERLHANEMPWPPLADASQPGLNRYPEPQPQSLVERLANLYGVRREQVLLGRGSDEGIDLLIRAFCRAYQDAIMICSPTYSMYRVTANIQAAATIDVPLKDHFALDAPAVIAAWNAKIKLIFLCSPNNPTGNLLSATDIRSLCRALDGKAIVVVDEAYIEFAESESLASSIDEFSNLVVLRTLSKAYSLAGARCGAVLAHPDIVSLLARMIQPYAMPAPTIEAALKFTAADAVAEVRRRIDLVRSERNRLTQELQRFPIIRRVFPSDANFLLLDCADAAKVLSTAIEVGLIIRDQRSQKALPTAVRISIGTPEQNARLVRGLQSSIAA